MQTRSAHILYKKVLGCPKILWLKFLNYFYYSCRPKKIDPINPIYHLRKNYQNRMRATLQNQKPALFDLITEMRKQRNSTGCSYGDYYELYKKVRILKPSFILECGSGISTCTITYAVKENSEESNQTTIFISMEENPFYHDQAKKVFPASLKQVVHFVQGDRKEKFYGP